MTTQIYLALGTTDLHRAEKCSNQASADKFTLSHSTFCHCPTRQKVWMTPYDCSLNESISSLLFFWQSKTHIYSVYLKAAIHRLKKQGPARSNKWVWRWRTCVTVSTLCFSCSYTTTQPPPSLPGSVSVAFACCENNCLSNSITQSRELDLSVKVIILNHIILPSSVYCFDFELLKDCEIHFP